VSLVFDIFELIRGPMKKYHVAVHTSTWKNIGHGRLAWKDDMTGDCVSGWHGTMVFCHMAQSWDSTWQWEIAQ
jgi:hypothetical protein